MKRPIALAVAAGIALLATTSAAWALGEFTQKPGKAGCISMTGNGGACEVGRALEGPREVAISPDGRNAYVPNGFSDAVAVFDRNPATGELSQKAGAAGCISQGGAGGCLQGTGLDGAVAAVVSPDGRHVYVASFESDAVAVFSRDPTNGALSQAPGQQGCISQAGIGGCSMGKVLDGARAIAISPDGGDVYVASFRSSGLAVLDRAQGTGELTQEADVRGCVSEDGTGGACEDGVALNGALNVEVSPDGANVYAASLTSEAVAVFDRGPEGLLAQKGGNDACVSESGSSGVCQDGVALVAAQKVAVSSDSRNVYVVGAEGVAIFDRDGLGRLAQKPGTAGCITDKGTAGACQDGAALLAANGIAIAPGGESVYVGSAARSPISIFDRDSTGALTQKPGLAGCVSDNGTGGGCQDAAAFVRDGDLTVSPDGRNLYFADNTSSKVSIFDRALPSPPPADTLAPTVTGFKAVPKRFKPGSKKKKGTRFRFVLSEPAAARIEIERSLAGRRVGKRCKPATPKLKDRKPCRRFKRRGELAVANLPAGANAVRFSGKIGKRALKPGAYRATIVATDAAGNRSAPRRAAFKVLP